MSVCGVRQDEQIKDSYPVFFDFADGRAAQKACFGAEFFPAELPEGLTGRAFLDFFQVDRQTSEPKGIIELRLDDG